MKVYGSELEKQGMAADGSKPGSNSDSTDIEPFRWIHIEPSKLPQAKKAG